MSEVSLVEEATRESHAITGTVFVVGRSAQADLPVVDPKCARKHFQIKRAGDRYLIEPLSAQHPTLVDGQRITAAQHVSHGSEVRAGDSVFRFVADAASAPPPRTAAPQPQPPSRPAPPQPSAFDAPIAPRTQISPPQAHPPLAEEMTRVAAPGETPAPPLPSGAFRLAGRQTIGRDSKQADIHLDHPVVSRIHAEIRDEAGGFTIRDRGSANGTFVNGRRVSRVQLAEGDRIDVGPYSLTLRGNQLLPESRSNNSHLACRNVQCSVRDTKTGTPIVLLDDISLAFHPREFVCILGPSGSGKSTLLRALSGRTPDIEGQVSVNGLDLRSCFQMLKPEMAMVPQHDILHEQLELRHSLRYTARLRLPPDLSDSEIGEAVDAALQTVGLTETR